MISEKGAGMSKYINDRERKFPRRLKQVHLCDLERVPYEQTPNYYLEQHRELLESRENARIEEERKAREEAKKAIVGGPADKTNY